MEKNRVWNPLTSFFVKVCFWAVWSSSNLLGQEVEEPIFSGLAQAQKEEMDAEEGVLSELRSEDLSLGLYARADGILKSRTGVMSGEAGFRNELALSEAELRSRDFSNLGDLHKERVERAIRLVEKYPELESGYRHLLSVAWKADAAIALSAVDIVKSGAASDGLRRRAERLLKSIEEGIDRPDTENDLIKMLKRGVLKEDTLSRVERFLSYSDEELGEGTRFRVDWAFRQARMRVEGPVGPRERHTMRMRDARELMSDHPKHEGGYRYLLSLAKEAEEGMAREAITDILESQAPEGIKSGALRLLRRLELQDNLFEPDWVGLDKVPEEGLVIYGWSAGMPPQAMIDRELAKALEVTFVGVNFDGDEKIAKDLADEWNLPGRQIVCDGLDSELAGRLGVVSEGFVYLIDGNGGFQELSAHRDFSIKLANFLSIELIEVGGHE